MLRMCGTAPRAGLWGPPLAQTHFRRVAAAAGVKTLVLSHLVPGETDAVTDKQWLAAARAHFSGRIVVGHDLMEL